MSPWFVSDQDWYRVVTDRPIYHVGDPKPPTHPKKKEGMLKDWMKELKKKVKPPSVEDHSDAPSKAALEQ